jgi:hypothetical protein
VANQQDLWHLLDQVLLKKITSNSAAGINRHQQPQMNGYGVLTVSETGNGAVLSFWAKYAQLSKNADNVRSGLTMRIVSLYLVWEPESAGAGQNFAAGF